MFHRHVWIGESASRVIMYVLIYDVVATQKVKRSTRLEQSHAMSRNGRRSIVYLAARTGRKNATANVYCCAGHNGRARFILPRTFCLLPLPLSPYNPYTYGLPGVHQKTCPKTEDDGGETKRETVQYIFDIKIPITRHPVNSRLILYRMRCQIKNH